MGIRRFAAVLVVCVAWLTPAVPGQASPITLTPTGPALIRVVGIDYHEPTDKVLVSLNYPSGTPHNFELVAQDGGHAQHSTVSGLTDEVKVATVRSGPCQGGFATGDTFAGTGVPGEIARISPDGTVVARPWVTLPGEAGLFRGGLYQDRWCVAGGDLIAVTTNGGVWRITSAGVPTQLRATGTFLEGVTTFPDDVARYGPFAGKIVAGAEHERRFHVIDPASGSATTQAIDSIAPEDLDIVPAGENLFVAEYSANRVLGAAASQLVSMVGDLVVTQELPGQLYRVRWDGGRFTSELIAEGSHFEHVAFAPSGIGVIPPANRAPVADAGFDQATPQTSPSGAEVILDGTRSTDPDGDYLTYSWSDGSTGPTPRVLAPPGTSVYRLTVTDAGGLTDTDEVVITVTGDGTPPTISGSRSPAPNSGGWNNTPVTVGFACGDPETGVSYCTPDTVLASDGAGQSVTGTATNGAGLTAETVVGGINIDQLDPSLAFTGNAGTYDVADRVTITCSASDSLSGLSTDTTCPALDAPAYEVGLGTHVLRATASDEAGNAAASSATFTVRATAEGACRLVESFVDSAGVAASLCGKLRSAASAQERGQEATHDRIMDAFRNEVRAQTGQNGLDAGEAQTLLDISYSL